MTEFGQRLKKARLDAGLTQAQLAKAAGVAQATISEAESAASGSAYTPQFAAVLSVSAHWLATGQGNSEVSNAQVVPSSEIPLLDWVSAGDWALSGSQVTPEEMLPCPMRCGSRTYALRIKGQSMYAPGAEESFSPGDVIFVDPDLEPLHGDFVVVRLDDSGEATFKRLLIEGNQKMLEAINPAWPERIVRVNGNASYCGVYLGSWKPSRRRGS